VTLWDEDTPMITWFRDFTKTWAFKALMVVLIAGFAVFGLRDVFSPMSGNDVITAGKREVTDNDFKQQFDNWKQQQVQQGQQPISNEDFVSQGLHVEMLNQLANQTAFMAWLDKTGVKPSAKLIVQQLAQIPAFVNSVTGKFDPQAYRQLLAQKGISEKTAESEFSDQVAFQHFSDAAIAGLKAPRIYATVEGAVITQARDSSIFVLAPNNVGQPPQPTDADLTAFYKENLSKLQLPEMRTAQVVMFAPEQFAADIPVNEDDIHKMYQDRLPTLSTPETRTFVEITAPNMAAANAISAALKAGQDPETVAKANKGSVLDYAEKPKSAVPDAKIADAAFAMKTGEVSGPVQGSLSIGVIRMGDIKIGSTPSYESVHEQLVNDYKKDKAADKLNQVVNDFQKAHEAGEDFEATAKRLNLKVVPLLPMTAEGKTPNPQEDYSRYPALVKDVFDLAPGSTSDVEELGNNQYVAIKLINVKPAGAPPFDQIKDQLALGWRSEKMNDMITAKADEAKARLAKGESFAAVAASYKAQVQPISNLSREAAQNSKLPQPLVSHIFFGKVGDVFTAPVAQFQIAVGRIDAIHQADPANANTMATIMGQQLSRAAVQDIGQIAQKSAYKTMKVKTNPNAAARALGVTPPDAKDKKS